ncbi:HPr family phosphocarrier protein [bacterium]|nr:HPr family phosphocarrier protein [bacterium]
MISKVITIVNKLGLHARPATMLVKTAAKYNSKITLRKEDLSVDAKSIMGVLILAAQKGTKLTVLVDGPDEEDAMEEVEELFASGFGEE